MSALPVQAQTEPRAAVARAPVVAAASASRAELEQLLLAAKRLAPEVKLAEAALTASRSALENGRLSPLGNPYLELTADRGSKGVTKDVTLSGALWLPVELSGQRGGRGVEAQAYVALYEALLENARAAAAARLVRAYGSVLVVTERMAVLTELLASARDEANLLAERVKNGDAIAPDSSLANVEAARHEVMLEETQAELEHVRAELFELVGSEVVQAQHAGTPPAITPQSLTRLHLERTPRARVLAAEARFFASSAERFRREGRGPFSLGLFAGRGDYGETRVGAGLAYAFPVFRSNQPERARANAESDRALSEKRLLEGLAGRRLRVLQREEAQVSRALTTLTDKALPAAELSVVAVKETYAAGKAEMLAVLLSRRELSALSLRRLELLEQRWALVSEYVAITGELP